MADFAGPATVKLNGRPLLHVQSARVRRAGNHRAVKTLALGLAGKTRGAPEVTIELRSAVPTTGLEATYRDLVLSGDDVTISFVAGGVEENFVGWFEECDTESEVDQPVGDSANFHGRRVASLNF